MYFFWGDAGGIFAFWCYVYDDYWGWGLGCWAFERPAWGAEDYFAWQCLIALSFIGSALIANFYAFVAIYGGLSAFALAAVQYVPMGVLVEETFKGSKNKGLIYALLINGTGLGFVILSPLWVYLNLTISWQEIYLILGVFFLVVLTPLLFVALPVSTAPSQNAAAREQHDPRFWQNI